MDRDFLMNVGDTLMTRYNLEYSKLDPLRRAALDSSASLSQHTDYNIAFERSRKDFETESVKILGRVEECLTQVDSEIQNKRTLISSSRAAEQKLDAEIAQIEAELNAEVTKIQELEVSYAKLENGQAAPTMAALVGEGLQEIRFYNAYEEALVNAKTFIFRAKNKLSAPSTDEVHSLRKQADDLRAMASSAIPGSIAASQEVDALLEDLTLRTSIASSNANPSDAVDSTVQVQENSRKVQQEDDFMKESAKLLQWCRQQKTDLEALTEPDHIQKFCSALEVNYKTMYDNFELLCAMGQELMPSAKVEKMLMECNEVWLNLQVYAHEILQHTMLEIHARSKLEDEVRAFSSYSTRFYEALHSLKEMFSLPMDEESREVVAGILEQTEMFEQKFKPFVPLTEHLKEFSLRMECIRDNYHNLRRTVFSRLTFLTAQQQQIPVVSTLSKNRRKEEYQQRLNDLRSWVGKKDTGESCKEIYDRVKAIKDLVDTEYDKVQYEKTLVHTN